MLKKLILSLAILFYFIVPVSAENWVSIGEDKNGYSILMDTDIFPVALFTNDGEVVLLEGMYLSRYKIAYDKENTKFLPADSIVDLVTLQSFSMGKWSLHTKGSDGMLYYAYLIKDYAEILEKEAFILQKEFIPVRRIPAITVDDNGWQKVYEHDDGSMAWIQTKSVQLSQYDEEQLPLVKVLARRLDVVDGAQTISYSYEMYDPKERIKYLLTAWDSKLKEIKLDESSKKVFLPALSNDAAVATVAYKLFATNHDEIEKHGQFALEDKSALIEKEWLVFSE